MLQFHVYIIQEQGQDKFIVVETTGITSRKDVDELLPPKVNWYGLLAVSPEDAIEKVKKAEFNSKSIEELKNKEYLHLKAELESDRIGNLSLGWLLDLRKKALANKAEEK